MGAGLSHVHWNCPIVGMYISAYCSSIIFYTFTFYCSSPLFTVHNTILQQNQQINRYSLLSRTESQSRDNSNYPRKLWTSSVDVVEAKDRPVHFKRVSADDRVSLRGRRARKFPGHVTSTVQPSNPQSPSLWWPSDRPAEYPRGSRSSPQHLLGTVWS